VLYFPKLWLCTHPAPTRWTAPQAITLLGNSARPLKKYGGASRWRCVHQETSVSAILKQFTRLAVSWIPNGQAARAIAPLHRGPNRPRLLAARYPPLITKCNAYSSPPHTPFLFILGSVPRTLAAALSTKTEGGIFIKVQGNIPTVEREASRYGGLGLLWVLRDQGIHSLILREVQVREASCLGFVANAARQGWPSRRTVLRD
jgi:hypothetical protein